MAKITLKESLFGITSKQEQVKRYTLATTDGFEVTLIDYGATIQSIRQADRENRFTEVTLGYDSLQEYVDDVYFFGCTVGRVTNRIKNARFELDGSIYQLEKNDGGKHHLHGVFNKRVWNSHAEHDKTVVFQYLSPDGEDGFPGDLNVVVTYKLTSDHRLSIDFRATCTKATPINLTNHAYFNLAGDTSGSTLGHRLLVAASQFTPLDEEHIPTGEIASVKNTAHDFGQFTRIGDHIDEVSYGFNVMFVVDGEGQRFFGKLVHDESGRAMSVESTQKGLQFYTGTFLDQVQGRAGTVYNKYAGLCLETQNFTDSVNNQPQFPSTILRPGEEYHEQTVFYFHTE